MRKINANFVSCKKGKRKTSRLLLNDIEMKNQIFIIFQTTNSGLFKSCFWTWSCPRKSISNIAQSTKLKINWVYKMQVSLSNGVALPKLRSRFVWNDWSMSFDWGSAQLQDQVHRFLRSDSLNWNSMPWGGKASS